MLSLKSTEIVLLMAPVIDKRLTAIKGKMLGYSDMQYHQMGLDAERFFSMVMEEKDRYDAFVLLKDAISTALNEIGERDRKIIESIYFDFATFQDIADLLGASKHTIWRRASKVVYSLSCRLNLLGITQEFVDEHVAKDEIYVLCDKYFDQLASRWRYEQK